MAVPLGFLFTDCGGSLLVVVDIVDAAEEARLKKIKAGGGLGGRPQRLHPSCGATAALQLLIVGVVVVVVVVVVDVVVVAAVEARLKKRSCCSLLLWILWMLRRRPA